MVKKFIKNTTMTSTKPSVAFTAPKAPLNPQVRQGITPNLSKIRLNNRAVPLNPNAPPFKPRSGNFGTKRIRGIK